MSTQFNFIPPMSIDIKAEKNEVRAGFNTNPDNNNLIIQLIIRFQQSQQIKIATTPTSNNNPELVQCTTFQLTSNFINVCLPLFPDSTTRIT